MPFFVFVFNITTGSKRVGECRKVLVKDTLNGEGKGTCLATMGHCINVVVHRMPFIHVNVLL